MGDFCVEGEGGESREGGIREEKRTEEGLGEKVRDFPEVEDREGEVGGRHPEVCRDTFRASGGRADVFLKDILDEM